MWQIQDEPQMNCLSDHHFPSRRCEKTRLNGRNWFAVIEPERPQMKTLASRLARVGACGQNMNDDSGSSVAT